jgi:formate hydrogenlyase transcriptional activator
MVPRKPGCDGAAAARPGGWRRNCGRPGNERKGLDNGGGMTNAQKSSLEATDLRRRAEEVLRADAAGGAPGPAVDDVQRLVHELQVHQIELEMQNEELRRAQAEVEAGLERYTDLYELAPLGYLTLGRDGAIRQVNLTGAGLLGVERARLAGRRFGVFVAEPDRAGFQAFLEKAFASQARQECEAALLKKGGAALHVRLTATCSPQGDECRVILADITEGKMLEEALQKAYAELEQQIEERTVGLRTALSEIKTMKEQLEVENIYFRQELKTLHKLGHILGQSDGLKYVLYRAEQVAPTDTTVLILGETGTGKDLIAAAIHDMSPRRDRPLITVNCAALPANLIESELFGREKGAFTGADTRQIGRFEIANGSTLCLDEIGELPLELQAKLLRVIQHNEFERLGSSQTIKVDARIVATTNRDLEEEIRKGRFRQDLYYRLNVFPITVPPLRQRKEDIPLMAEVFIERYARKLGKRITSVQAKTMEALENYPWPGNVRELESVLERAVILCSGPVLQLADKLVIPAPPKSSAIRTLDAVERNQIMKILSETRWRIEGKDGAAAILGIHPSTLRARMHKLGIVRPEAKELD